MKQNAQALLKFLLAASDHKDELLRFFPPAFGEEVEKFTLNTGIDASRLFTVGGWAVPIHYSWFSEILEDYPNPVKPFFLAALTPEQSAGLQKMLSLEGKQTILPLLRPFLLQILRRAMLDVDLLPAQLLPPSALNQLLALNRRQLLHLIDFLGLHDLAADLRQVVDKELLKKIHQALTADQLQFLQYCSKQPLKWVPPKIGLVAWDGSKQQLNRLLHHRGLIRLARAVVQEDPSFRWHLVHHLDTGRAKIIQKEFYKKQESALLPYFKNQVLHIAKRYHA